MPSLAHQVEGVEWRALRRASYEFRERSLQGDLLGSERPRLGVDRPYLGDRHAIRRDDDTPTRTTGRPHDLGELGLRIGDRKEFFMVR